MWGRRTPIAGLTANSAHFPDNPLQIALYSLIPFYVIAIILFLILSRVLKRESEAEKAAAA